MAGGAALSSVPEPLQEAVREYPLLTVSLTVFAALVAWVTLTRFVANAVDQTVRLAVQALLILTPASVAYLASYDPATLDLAAASVKGLLVQGALYAQERPEQVTLAGAALALVAVFPYLLWGVVLAGGLAAASPEARESMFRGATSTDWIQVGRTVSDVAGTATEAVRGTAAEVASGRVLGG